MQLNRIGTWIRVFLPPARRAGIFFVLLASFGINPTAPGAAAVIRDFSGQAPFGMYFVTLWVTGAMLIMFSVERGLAPMGAITYVLMGVFILINMIEIAARLMPIRLILPPVHIGPGLTPDEQQATERIYRRLLRDTVRNAGYSLVFGNGDARWEPDTPEQQARKRETQEVRLNNDPPGRSSAR